MKRVFTPVLFVAALVLSACGGHTGLEVIVEPAPSLVPERDFEKIRVSVNNIDPEVTGKTYPVTEATEKPYRVIVLAGYEKDERVNVTVQLLKQDFSVVREHIETAVKFEPGELKTLVFKFED